MEMVETYILVDAENNYLGKTESPIHSGIIYEYETPLGDPNYFELFGSPKAVGHVVHQYADQSTGATINVRESTVYIATVQLLAQPNGQPTQILVLL